jgi:dienelactone hydrolase
MAALAVLLLASHCAAESRASASTAETTAATVDGGGGIVASISSLPPLPAPAAAAAAPLPLPGVLQPGAGGGRRKELVADPDALLAAKAHQGAVELLAAAAGDTTLAGVAAYVAAPPRPPPPAPPAPAAGAAAPQAKAGAKGDNKTASSPPAPRSAILIYSDIYGYRGNGTRRWADRLASLGYVVAVPDFFLGRSAMPGSPAAAEGRAFILSLPKANVTRQASDVVAALRKRYPTVTKVAAYGFCWGGRYAAVAAGAGVDGTGAAADAAVSYHAALIAPDEFAAIERPILFVNAAGDPLFNATAEAEVAKAAARGAKAAASFEVATKTFEGVRHGFAVRSAPNDTVATAASEAAFQDGLAFLKKHGVAP